MSIGPVEYLLISFPGNRFDGTIVPELERLIASGTIRILDVVFVSKDPDGVVSVFEYDGIGEEAAAFAALDGEAGGLLNDDDVAGAADALEPGSSGMFFVWEDLWAAPLAEALRRADGVIVDGGRIPHADLEAAFEYVANAG